MRYLYHKQPLVIKAKKQNEYHERFNEKVFYHDKNPHTTATYRLLHLSKKIKFMFLLYFIVSLVLGLGYAFSTVSSNDSASSKVIINEIQIDNEDSQHEDKETSDFESINDVTITSEN